MNKLAFGVFVCLLALAGCESTPVHSLVGTWFGQMGNSGTKQVFGSDGTYTAITETQQTRVTQHGTYLASDTQLTITNGEARVEGTNPEVNLRQENELYGNKGKKSIATLKWNGDDQVQIFNSVGDPPLTLYRKK